MSDRVRKKQSTVANRSRSNTLVSHLAPGQTPSVLEAEMLVGGLTMNAVTAVAFSKHLGELDLTACVAAIQTSTRRVQNGDLAGLEATLAAQVVTLNAMFTQLAHQTSRMTLVDQIDRFTRLALKAQGQCRATAETLALMKNPPVFARQANIAHGPQQVNNGTVIPSRAENSEPQPIELMEPHADLDRRAKKATGESN